MEFPTHIDPESSHDPDFFLEPQLATEFVCFICIHVPFDPVTHSDQHAHRGYRRTTRCSGVFCRRCYANTVERATIGAWDYSVPCPQNCGGLLTDREGTMDIYPLPLERQRVLDSLVAKCGYEDC